MLDVFITIDTEIWVSGWSDLDEHFPDAFRRYIYGPTKYGNDAMPATVKLLTEHGLRGVFFVEPLFSIRFGQQALQDIIGIIQESGHEIQLHLHPEWIDEFSPSPLAHIKGKTQFLRSLSYADQTKLIALGKSLLRDSGVSTIDAFRAGSYAANTSTLKAIAANDIYIDTSYNSASKIGTADIAPNRVLLVPEKYADVTIYPVTTFLDGIQGRQRHLQITACSSTEIEWVLNRASDLGWGAVVIVSHNFELLNRSKNKRDPIVFGRFKRLCSFLERHRDRFNVRGFSGLTPTVSLHTRQLQPIIAPILATGRRHGEQAIRRLMT